MSKPRQSLRGELFGVELSERGPGDPHISVTVCLEDDENWHPKMNFSAFWLDDLLQVLKQAKRECKRLGEPDPSGCGLVFKDAKHE